MVTTLALLLVAGAWLGGRLSRDQPMIGWIVSAVVIAAAADLAGLPVGRALLAAIRG